MLGESPGRDWDALLTPRRQSLDEVLAEAQQRHRRKMRQRTWSIFTVVVISVVFIAWSALLWPILGQPHVLLVPWLVGYGVVLWLTVMVLQRLERLFIPPAERELALEES